MFYVALKCLSLTDYTELVHWFRLMTIRTLETLEFYFTQCAV